MAVLRSICSSNSEEFMNCCLEPSVCYNSISCILDKLISQHCSLNQPSSGNKVISPTAGLRKLKFKLYELLLTHRKESQSTVCITDRIIWLSCQLAGSGHSDGLHKAQAIDSCLNLLESYGSVGKDGVVDAVLSLLLALAKPDGGANGLTPTSHYDSCHVTRTTQVMHGPDHDPLFYDKIIKLPDYSKNGFSGHNLAKWEQYDSFFPCLNVDVVHNLHKSKFDDKIIESFNKHGSAKQSKHGARKATKSRSNKVSKFHKDQSREIIEANSYHDNLPKNELGWMKLCSGLPGCGISHWFFPEDKVKPDVKNCLGATVSAIHRDLSPSSSRLTVPRLPEDGSTPIIIFPSMHFAKTEAQVLPERQKPSSSSSIHSTDEGYNSSQGSGRFSPDVGDVVNAFHTPQHCPCDGTQACLKCDPTAVWEEVAEERLSLGGCRPKTWEEYQIKLLQRQGNVRKVKADRLIEELHNKKDLPSIINAGTATTHNVWYELQARWRLILPPSPHRGAASVPAVPRNTASPERVPKLCVVSSSLLCQRVLYAVIGLPSDTFLYNVTTECFSVARGTCYNGVTPEALLPMLKEFAITATHYRRLELLCESFSSRGCRNSSDDAISAAFITSLRALLHNFRGEILQLLGCDHFLQLRMSLDDYLQRVNFLARICFISDDQTSSFSNKLTHHDDLKSFTPTATEAKTPVDDQGLICSGKSTRKSYNKENSSDSCIQTKNAQWRFGLPGGLSLLGSLLNELVEPCSKSCSVLLLRLLAAAAQPFLRSLERWVFEGIPCSSVVSVNHEALSYKDRRFYSEAFSVPRGGIKNGVPQSPVPALFTELLHSALGAGKDMNFLKIIEPQHALVRRLRSAPSLRVCVRARQVGGVRKQCTAYVAAVQRVLRVQQELVLSRRTELAHRKQQQMDDSVKARRQAETDRQDAAAAALRERQQHQQALMAAMRAADAEAKNVRARELRAQEEKELQLEQQWQRQQEQLQLQHLKLKDAVEKFYGNLSAVTDSRDSDHDRVRAQETRAHALSKEESDVVLPDDDKNASDCSDSEEESPSDVTTVVRLQHQLQKQTSSDDVEDSLENTAPVDESRQKDDGDGAVKVVPFDSMGNLDEKLNKELEDVCPELVQNLGKDDEEPLAADAVAADNCTDSEAAMTASAMSTSSDATAGGDALTDLSPDGCPDDENDTNKVGREKEFLSWKELSRDESLKSALAQDTQKEALRNKNRFMESNVFSNANEECVHNNRNTRKDTISSIFSDDCSNDLNVNQIRVKTVIGEEAAAIRKKILEQEYGLIISDANANLNVNESVGTNINDLNAGATEGAVDVENNECTPQYNLNCEDNPGTQVEIKLTSLKEKTSEMDEYLHNRLANAENKKKMLDQEYGLFETEAILNHDVDTLANVAFGNKGRDVADDPFEPTSAISDRGFDSECLSGISDQIKVSDLTQETADGSRSDPKPSDSLELDTGSVARSSATVISKEETYKLIIPVSNSPLQEEQESRDEQEEILHSSGVPEENAAPPIRSPLPPHSLYFALSLNDKTPLLDILGTALNGHPSRCSYTVGEKNPRNLESSTQDKFQNYDEKSDFSCSLVPKEAEEFEPAAANVDQFPDAVNDDSSILSAENVDIEPKTLHGTKHNSGSDDSDHKNEDDKNELTQLGVSDDEDADLVPDGSLMTVPVHILRALSLVVNTQLSVCGRAAVLSLLHTHGLLHDFTAIREWLLLQDAAYAASLTTALTKHQESGKLPVTVLTPMVLNSVISSALAESARGNSTRAEQLSFVLLEGVSPPPSFTYASSITSLVRLQYRVSWPACVVLTPELLQGFSRVSSLLLSVHSALHATDVIFSHVKLLGRLEGRGLTLSPQFHAVCLQRHNIAHFLRSLHTFLHSQVLSVCGGGDDEDDAACDALVGDCSSMDQLSESLHASLTALSKRCFLSSKASPVLTLLQKLLSLVHLFKAQLMAHNWILQATDSGGSEYRHRAFASLQSTHSTFRSNAAIFTKLLTRVRATQHVQHVEELLALIDYNQHYSHESTR